MPERPTWAWVTREKDNQGRCRHYDCQALTAASLFSEGRMLEAIKVHEDDQRVTCQRPKGRE